MVEVCHLEARKWGVPAIAYSVCEGQETWNPENHEGKGMCALFSEDPNLPRTLFNLSETLSLFHCSQLEFFCHLTPARSCTWHFYSCDFLAANLSRVAQCCFCSGVLPVPSLLMGIYHCSVSFFDNRNFQQIPAVLFPRKKLSYFSVQGLEQRKQGKWDCCQLCTCSIPFTSAGGREEWMCKERKPDISKRNQECQCGTVSLVISCSIGYPLRWLPKLTLFPTGSTGPLNHQMHEIN